MSAFRRPVLGTAAGFLHPTMAPPPLAPIPSPIHSPYVPAMDEWDVHVDQEGRRCWMHRKAGTVTYRDPNRYARRPEGLPEEMAPTLTAAPMVMPQFNERFAIAPSTHRALHLSRPASARLRQGPSNGGQSFEAAMRAALEASLLEAEAASAASADEPEAEGSLPRFGQRAPEGSKPKPKEVTRTGSSDTTDGDVQSAIEASLREVRLIEENKQRLHHNLATWGFEERPVPGDNNCQFHAIADQLNQLGLNSWNALSVRVRICEWLHESGAKEMDDGSVGGATTLQDAVGVANWENYVAEMCLHDETWGDEASLLAASVLWEAEVIVISSISDDIEKSVRVITPPEHWKVKQRKRLYVGHYHEYHYTSVAPSSAS